MSQMTVGTPYDSARLMFGSNIETWLNAYDAARLASYKLYEDIYWNNPDTFKLVMRGTNEFPIYIPTGRIICNTMNRYVCRDMQFGPDPLWGDATSREEISTVFGVFFKRERFLSKFNTQKLYGIMRGDSTWLITGNSDKPEGSRVDLEEIDPGSVFWVYDDDNSYKILGVDIVEQLVYDNTQYIKRQRWLKSNHPDHPTYTDPPTMDGEISYQVDTFEIQDWEDPAKAKGFNTGEAMPAEIVPGITKLPVYHWKNFDQPENPWGISEMRGLETIISGANQGVSDQDLALAIAGLGQYWTDAGAPVDDEGNEGTWGLGPAEVIEIAVGRKFERLNGITTVDPSLNHIRFLQEQAFRTSGASDVAQGQVEVQMAESGIALQLRMGPILDEAGIKEILICDSLNQMLFDLKQWFEVYEGVDFGEYDPMDPASSPAVIGIPGDKLPEDKEARRKALLEGYNAIPSIFSGSFVRAELRRMGWDLPTDEEMMKQIAEEAAFFSSATDPDGARLDEEADAEDESVEEEPEE